MVPVTGIQLYTLTKGNSTTRLLNLLQLSACVCCWFAGMTPTLSDWCHALQCLSCACNGCMDTLRPVYIHSMQRWSTALSCTLCHWFKPELRYAMQTAAQSPMSFLQPSQMHKGPGSSFAWGSTLQGHCYCLPWQAMGTS